MSEDQFPTNPGVPHPQGTLLSPEERDFQLKLAAVREAQGASAVDTETAFADDEFGRREKERAETLMRRKLDYMSLPGALDLPPLLEKARWRFGIVDAAFREQACFDRVLAYQVPQIEGDKFSPSGRIHMADQGKSRETEEAPRAVIISAGLRGLDELRSNGIDIGHIVGFVRMSPWRKPIGEKLDGKTDYLMIFRTGDIISSETLCEEMRNGEKGIASEHDENNTLCHYIVATAESKEDTRRPSMPWMDPSY